MKSASGEVPVGVAKALKAALPVVHEGEVTAPEHSVDDLLSLLLGKTSAAIPEPAGAAASSAASRRRSSSAQLEVEPATREEQEPPDELVCPITQELMQDPVMCADGESYERNAIEAWFARGKRTVFDYRYILNEFC